MPRKLRFYWRFCPYGYKPARAGFFTVFCKFLAAVRSNIVVMAEINDDELLVKKFKQGDESIFERIVRQYSAGVAVLANRLLGWPGEVEDVTQDVFLAAYLGLKKFRCQCSLKTWLFTITINKCRSYRYKRMLRLRQRVPGLRPKTAPAADRRLTDRETVERIGGAIRALAARYREPIVLRYLQELPTEEICRILGISENSLQVRLSRARKRLRHALAELIEE
jgi:RNA polymerase sigma-70 factor (ECF subfamily)